MQPFATSRKFRHNHSQSSLQLFSYNEAIVYFGRNFVRGKRGLGPQTCETWSQLLGITAPPRPGRQATTFTFLQFLQSRLTEVALAFVLDAAMMIPLIFTNREIELACQSLCSVSQSTGKSFYGRESERAIIKR